MAELTVIRHGQASFGAANYDKLSDLGWQQARWLGEYFAQRGMQFDHVVTGTLVRHRETLSGIQQGMGLSPAACLEHPGLNEYDSSVMFKARAAAGKMDAIDEHNLNLDRRYYFRQLREALYEWSDGLLQPPDYQTFLTFRRGVIDGMQAAMRADAKRVLLVSSGGPISNMVGQVLQVPNRVTVDLNLQTRNASISQFAYSIKSQSSIKSQNSSQSSSDVSSLALMSFNNIPHLDSPDRLHAVTYS